MKGDDFIRVLWYLQTSGTTWYNILLKMVLTPLKPIKCNESLNIYKINVREYRNANDKWTIQRTWQQDEEKQNKNTTQYVLDTTIRKQTQIWHEPSHKQLEIKTNRTSPLCGNRITPTTKSFNNYTRNENNSIKYWGNCPRHKDISFKLSVEYELYWFPPRKEARHEVCRIGIGLNIYFFFNGSKIPGVQIW